MSKDNALLADISNAAKAIERFLQGVTFDQYSANEEKYEAVNRKFEIIGEAARRLSPATQAKLPGIPWRLLTAMRNLLIHDYDDIDLRIVWETAQKDLPPLIKALDDYFLQQPPPPGGAFPP